MTAAVPCKYCALDWRSLHAAIRQAEARRWRTGVIDTSDIDRFRERVSKCQHCYGTGDAEGRALPKGRALKPRRPTERAAKPQATVPPELLREALAQVVSPAPRKPYSDHCPECGRSTPLRRDGTFKRHRPQADAYIGPYCTGSGQVAA